MGKMLDSTLSWIFEKMAKAYVHRTGSSLTDAKVPVVQEVDGKPYFNLSSIGSADLAKLSGANALDGTIADAISGLITALTQKGNLYNTNIDDITDFGIYRLGNENSSSGDHVPDWGLLIVLNTGAYDGLYQIHVEFQALGSLFIRNRINEEWSSWIKI